jgi:uncharacterized metal-binding protein YceD (DUF177 family)
MSGSAAPEFSRRIPLSRLGAEPLRQEIEATAAERAALACRFDLVALDRLSAVVELSRRGADMIALRADFSADFVQSCVVTLEPVGGSISQRFSLLYGPPEREAGAGLGIDDETAFEPLRGEAIDIGEAVAQEFALALPPFPRRPDAVIEAAPAPHQAGAFAALARLFDRRKA